MLNLWSKMRPDTKNWRFLIKSENHRICPSEARRGRSPIYCPSGARWVRSTIYCPERSEESAQREASAPPCPAVRIPVSVFSFRKCEKMWRDESTKVGFVVFQGSVGYKRYTKMNYFVIRACQKRLEMISIIFHETTCIFQFRIQQIEMICRIKLRCLSDVSIRHLKQPYMRIHLRSRFWSIFAPFLKILMAKSWF